MQNAEVISRVTEALVASFREIGVPMSHGAAFGRVRTYPLGCPTCARRWPGDDDTVPSAPRPSARDKGRS